MDSMIRDGDYFILDENGEKKTIHHMRPNLTAKIGKGFLHVGHLMDTPWGATYQVSADGYKLERLAVHNSIISPQVEEVDKDNSRLFDKNELNQTLKEEDIEAMRAEGKAGEVIIDALCKSSATFEAKTEYAQDKYKKRKARKYMVQITLLRPTARLLCQSMFDKNPAKVWNMRPDTLGILLSLANVAAYSRVLLLENCQGLLAAAVAERLGGYGMVCCASTNDKAAPLDSVRSMNFNQQQRGAICCAPLAGLLAAKLFPQPAADQQGAALQPPAANGCEAGTGSSSPMAVDDPAAANSPSQQQQQQEQAPSDEEEEEEQRQQSGKDSARDGKRAAANAGSTAAAKHTYTAPIEQQRQLVQPGFSSCIIAAPKLQVHAALEAVWPLLAPSCTFVVYSPWMQPLAEAMQQLSSSKKAVMLQLQESWLRPYQMLPGRSHPNMNMTTGGTGGYLLSGIVVADAPAVATNGQAGDAAADEPVGAGEGRGPQKRNMRGRGPAAHRGKRGRR